MSVYESVIDIINGEVKKRKIMMIMKVVMMVMFRLKLVLTMFCVTRQPCCLQS